VVLIASMSLFGKKVAPAYEIGTFQGSGHFSDGVFISGDGGNSESHEAGHGINTVVTPEGLYYIHAPINMASSVALGMLTNGVAPVIYKRWFMDDLHEGDQVLFNATCNKRGFCTIRLPDPHNPQKVIKTFGSFRPTIAKTNEVNALCGTGKLTPDAEAELCPMAPIPAPKIPE
jgi:hypothetical protein